MTTPFSFPQSGQGTGEPRDFWEQKSMLVTPWHSAVLERFIRGQNKIKNTCLQDSSCKHVFSFKEKRVKAML